MPLPGDLTTIQATGTFLDAEGGPMRGTVTFTPNTTLTDASGEVIIPQFPRTYPLFDGTFLTDPMVATDCADISPQGWAYEVTVALQAVPAWTFTILLPHSGAPIDISTLLPTSGTPYLPGYLPVTGGALSGTLTLDGSPPLRIAAGAVAGDILTSDSSGNASWGPPGGGGTFSVKAFGAALNGTTDDTAAWAAAVSAASAAGGGTVTWTGNSLINGSGGVGVTIPANVQIAGGMTSMQLSTATPGWTNIVIGSNSLTALFSVTGNNVAIGGFTVTAANAGCAVPVIRSSSARQYYSSIYANNTGGLYLDGLNRSTISNVNLASCNTGYGFYLPNQTLVYMYNGNASPNGNPPYATLSGVTLNAGITAGATVTSVTVTALNAALTAGQVIVIGTLTGNIQPAVVAAGASIGATSLSVVSFTAAYSFTAGAAVQQYTMAYVLGGGTLKQYNYNAGSGWAYPKFCWKLSNSYLQDLETNEGAQNGIDALYFNSGGGVVCDGFNNNTGLFNGYQVNILNGCAQIFLTGGGLLGGGATGIINIDGSVNPTWDISVTGLNLRAYAAQSGPSVKITGNAVRIAVCGNSVNHNNSSQPFINDQSNRTDRGCSYSGNAVNTMPGGLTTPIVLSAYAAGQVSAAGNAGISDIISGVAVSGTPSAGYVLTAGSPAAASWQAASVPAATTSTVGGVELTADLGGTATAPHVVHTNLAAALPLAQGGTNNTTGQPSGTASGDLSGTYPGPAVAKIQGTAIGSPPGGTTQFLRGDGTWQVPAGGGISPPAGDIGGTTGSPTVAKIQGTAVSSPPGGTTLYLAGNGTWQVPAGAGAPVPSIFNVLNYGAKGNTLQVTDGAMSASSATLTCSTSHPFTSSLVNVGQTVVVQGAGTSGADLVTTISAYTSSSVVTLTASASTTVTTAVVTFGTDDTTAIQSAATAAFAYGGAEVYFPAAPGYLTTASVTGTGVGNGMRATGDGNGSLVYPTGNYEALSFTNGTGLTIDNLQIQSALSAPTAGAAIGIHSIADYRIDKVTTGGTFYGVATSGGTSKTANITNSYIDAYAVGMYCPGSLTVIGSHIGGGAIGLILDSGSGHSVRLSRVGLYGPLPLTTRNSGMGTVPNKTVWFEAVEINNQAGLGSGALAYMTGSEAPGGMNLDNCGGDIHIGQCWLAGSGLTIGGGNRTTGGRVDTGCTITSGSTTVLDSHILSGDNGATVAGQGIPPGTTISSVIASTSFVMSAAATFSSSAGTPGGTVSVNVGGTTAQLNPTWVDIAGGVYSGNTGTLNNGIHLKAGTEISITGCLMTGASNHTATDGTNDDIRIESAVTGPVSITGCNFSGNCWQNISSAATSGPVTITGNAFNGYSAPLPLSYPGGSASQYVITGNANAATLIPSSVTGGMVTLTDAGTIAVDASLGNHFRVTIAANRTLGTPSNPADGQKITVEVIQGSGGSHTLGYTSGYIFSTSLPSPALSTAAGSVDVLEFLYSATISKWRFASFTSGFSS